MNALVHRDRVMRSGASTRASHVPHIPHIAWPLSRWPAALLDPEAPVPPGLVAAGRGDVASRFGVYRNNVVVSLTGVLADTFPVVREWVGGEGFEALARAFIRAGPPGSPVMTHYGAGLPGWLESFAASAGQPCLPDLARLEWARLQALHAADATAVDTTALADAWADADALPGLVMQLHPSVQVLRSAHAVVSVWAAHQLAPLARDAELGRLTLDRAEAALALRAGDEPLIVPLRVADAPLIAALQAGQPLGAAVEAAPAADMTTTLTLLLRHGAVVALRPATVRSGMRLETPP